MAQPCARVRKPLNPRTCFRVAIGMSGCRARAAWACARSAKSPDFDPTQRAGVFSGGLRLKQILAMDGYSCGLRLATHPEKAPARPRENLGQALSKPAPAWVWNGMSSARLKRAAGTASICNAADCPRPRCAGHGQGHSLFNPETAVERIRQCRDRRAGQNANPRDTQVCNAAWRGEHGAGGCAALLPKK